MAGMQQVAKMALQQSLSPQMQQSLNILQAPLTELRQLVDTELRANPALEEVAPEKPALNEEAPASNLEDQWNEYYSQRATAEPWTREALERRQHFLDSQVRPPTLTEHLLEQLHTASWPREEATIAAEIIGNLDDGGYLRASIEEIAANGVTGAQSEVSKAVSARPVRRELEWNDTESKSVTTMASDRAISSVP